jgi:NAD(P)-dependent dehydrogenase (short-subunit alcohol dehydrogenase family)
MGQNIGKGSAEGRVAVITGGGAGIGLAAAQRCASMGMKVVIADIKESVLITAKQSIEAAYPGSFVVGVRCDVSELSSVEALKEAVYSDNRLGEVGFLFNNAGLARDETFSAINTPIEHWKATFAVNLYGILHCLKCFVPEMQKQSTECVIVNTSSYAGLLNVSSQGFGGGVSYTASKHAVTVLTEALEHELRLKPGNRIAVHGLFPAVVTTSFLANAEEAALTASHDEEERQKKKAELASKPIKAQWTSAGITAEALVQLLFEGVEQGGLCTCFDLTIATS